MMQDYLATCADPAYISLRENIALSDAMVHDLLAKMDTGESGWRWRELKKAITAYDAADFGSAEQYTALSTMRELISQECDDLYLRDEILKWSEQAERGRERERKMLVEMRLVLTYEHVLGVLEQTYNVIREFVPPERLTECGAEIARIMNRESRGGLPVLTMEEEDNDTETETDTETEAAQ